MESVSVKEELAEMAPGKLTKGVKKRVVEEATERAEGL